ncbi:MAG: hypothetical protein ABJM06_10350 [Gilvibacter sp.]
MKMFSLGLFFSALLIMTSCSQDQALEEINETETANLEAAKLGIGSYEVEASFLQADSKSAKFNCATTSLVEGLQREMGEIFISSDSRKLYITFRSDYGFIIDATNLYVGSMEELPTYSSGNPRVSDFPYREVHSEGPTSVTYTLPLADFDPCFYVVAHAVQTRLDVTGTPILCVNTWAKGAPMGGSYNAMVGNFCKTGCTMEDGPIEVR